MNHDTIRRVSTVAAAAGLGLATLSAAPAADAASTQPGDFSSAVSPNPQVFTVDDCTVEVGIVYDWTPYPNYAQVAAEHVRQLVLDFVSGPHRDDMAVFALRLRPGQPFGVRAASPAQ